MKTNCKQMIDKLEEFSDSTAQFFKEIYGNDTALIEERRESYICVLKKHLDNFGNNITFISRSPARINLLGKHIEHSGGSVNSLSVSRETIVAVSMRDDNIISVSNVDNAFEKYCFNIPDAETVKKFSSWVDYIESDKIVKEVAQNQGKWYNYIKSAIYKIRMMFQDKMLYGMNMTFYGNIPQAAGLSSSSSIVVATAMSFLKINNIDISNSLLTELCGEAEWFVGSRGGAGDHAAMICSKINTVTHFSFFPFSIGKSVGFPDSFAIIVANSFVEAKKSAGAKDKFNSKVSSYKFGIIILKNEYPQFRDKLKILRDFNADNLDISKAEIYKMLLSLPEKISADMLLEKYKDDADEINHILLCHKINGDYNIRGTVLYGISECERAEKFIDFLEANDMKSMSEMIKLSHNGDRIYYNGTPFSYDLSDNHLKYLYKQAMNNIKSADIFRQCGSYSCSLERIDKLTDYATSIDGVISAEISGAGLGGCVVIIAQKDKADTILNKLYEGFYKKEGLPQGAAVYTSVNGACVTDDF